MKNLIIALVFVTVALHGKCQTIDALCYPSKDKIFVTWYMDNPDVETIGIYRFQQNEDPDTKGRKPRYMAKSIRNGYDIRNILGDRYDYIADLLGVTSPEEIPYRMDQLSGLEDLICTMVPELAIIQGKGFIDKNVKEGETYKYTLYTMQKAGKRTVPDKELISLIVKAEGVEILPPKFNTAHGAKNKIHLFFQNSESPSVGIDIYRSESPNGTFEKINDVKIVVSETLSSDIPTYTDYNIMPGRTYWYTLGTEDIFGKLSNHSDTLSAKASGCIIKNRPVLNKIRPTDKDQYELSWSHPYDPNVSEYIIYSSKDYQTIGKIIEVVKYDVNSIEFDIDNDIFHYYRVCAVSENGDCELYSYQQIYRPALSTKETVSKQ